MRGITRMNKVLDDQEAEYRARIKECEDNLARLAEGDDYGFVDVGGLRTGNERIDALIARERADLETAEINLSEFLKVTGRS